MMHRASSLLTTNTTAIAVVIKNGKDAFSFAGILPSLGRRLPRGDLFRLFVLPHSRES